MDGWGGRGPPEGHKPARLATQGRGSLYKASKGLCPLVCCAIMLQDLVWPFLHARAALVLDPKAQPEGGLEALLLTPQARVVL